MFRTMVARMDLEYESLYTVLVVRTYEDQQSTSMGPNPV